MAPQEVFMRWFTHSILLLLLAVMGLAASGCHAGRLVYSQRRGEVSSTMVREDLQDLAADLGSSFVTNGDPWRLEGARANHVRVSHAQPRHLTYIDLYFYDHPDGSTYAARGFSKAMGGYWTMGISDSATQGIAKPKIQEFLDELNTQGDCR